MLSIVLMSSKHFETPSIVSIERPLASMAEANFTDYGRSFNCETIMDDGERKKKEGWRKVGWLNIIEEIS